MSETGIWGITKYECYNKIILHCFADMQIDTLLFRDLQFAYFDFIGEILTDCEYNPSLGRVPIQFLKPIYGTLEPHFTDFAAPGVILT